MDEFRDTIERTIDIVLDHATFLTEYKFRLCFERRAARDLKVSARRPKVLSCIQSNDSGKTTKQLMPDESRECCKPLQATLTSTIRYVTFPHYVIVPNQYRSDNCTKRTKRLKSPCISKSKSFLRRPQPKSFFGGVTTSSGGATSLGA